MRILLVSGELIASPLCHRLMSEGHDFKLYIRDDARRDCLDGIIPKVENWKDELEWVGKDGLIIFDDLDYGQEQDDLRKQGYKVVGGSAGGDALELDRGILHKVLSDSDLPTLPSFDFESADEAIDHIKKNPDRWVVKQSSHIGMLNYVGELEDGKDAIDTLRGYKDKGITPVHIQKRAFGIEVGVARYFNGSDWVGPIEINHEHKHLCNEAIGPLTAEMGTVIWYSNNENLPLFAKTLGKLKDYLIKIDYRGDIDINCIVDKDTAWPLEATARFGSPSTALQCAMHKSPWGDFLMSVADGKNYNLEHEDGVGVVVAVALPPFPYPPNSVRAETQKSNNEYLYFKEPLTLDEEWHVHLEEISKKQHLDGSEYLYWSGEFGYALYVTGVGKDIHEARDRAYKIINKIILPKKIYRTDIGIKFAEHDHATLKEWGWI